MLTYRIFWKPPFAPQTAATRNPGTCGGQRFWHTGGLALYHEAWWAKRRDAGIKTGMPRNYRLSMRLADEFGQVPVVVLVCATSKGSGAAGSVIPAVQNLLLAARALGVGGTITTLHSLVEERVHKLFGIPQTAQVVYCIPLGYPRGRFGPNQRKPLTEVCSYDHWGTAPPWR
jgi:nitroreductase